MMLSKCKSGAEAAVQSLVDALSGYKPAMPMVLSTGPTKRPQKVLSRSPKPRKLTKHEIKVLHRARIAQDFGRRIITWGEHVLFTSGRNTDWVTWKRLRSWGLVSNSGVNGVRLTKKGERRLKELGK